MKTKHLIGIVLSVAIAHSTPLFAAKEATQDDKAAIKHVLLQFKTAIEEKDEASFLKLFHQGNVSWTGVISDQTIEMLVDIDERYRQQPKITDSSPKEFIAGIIASEIASREEAQNIKITSDGSVANVVFDYEFYKNNKLNNWGQENWQLLNTADGWKINAVNFSYTLNPERVGGQKNAGSAQ